MIKTPRLILRPWQEEDLHPFALMNGDPRVMEYFPSILSREESDQLAMRIQSKMENKGWGFWVASLADTQEFIGFIGLNELLSANFPVPFAPAIEIGWRLAYPFWNKGYATEGAKAALHYGFETLHLNEIVSFTAVENVRSRQVMERIGMTHHATDDFDHPSLPEGHRLKRHVLYRLKCGEWKKDLECI
jgi:3-dehydroquinate dehydratase/shikimate dehydrogenase